MSHLIRNETKLAKGVARIRGPVEAVARALEEGGARARSDDAQAADELVEVVRSYRT